jgi:hypothetical protein
LAENSGRAWPSDHERVEDLQDIVTNLSLGPPGRWRVESGVQMTSNPGEPARQQAVHVVTKGDDGGVFTTPFQASANAMAGSRNALESHLKEEMA